MRQYLVITASYWMFTLTDGALRMLVILYFHQLGYSALQIAFLFLFYEAFGVVTNLIGGYLGDKFGVNRLMNGGLILQAIALCMLLVPEASLTIIWVMAAQALSGVAKDLNKMSAKSAIKYLLPDDAQGRLFKWVALLTGSKNALKGVGFFVGAVLLTFGDFRVAVLALLGVIAFAFTMNALLLKGELGKAVKSTKFTHVFSRSAEVNKLSVARLFLFASRDVWFVVGLPVYFSSELGFSHWQTGSFMAVWIIAYGLVQAVAPQLTGLLSRGAPDGRAATCWAISLLLVTILVATGVQQQWAAIYSLLPGLFLFGAMFAVNSSVHSFLIVNYANRDHASVDVGFYYMANAAGRLAGTLLSGWLYINGGLLACLVGSCVLLVLASGFSLLLPSLRRNS